MAFGPYFLSFRYYGLGLGLGHGALYFCALLIMMPFFVLALGLKVFVASLVGLCFGGFEMDFLMVF
jgi:hypothetical protein